MNQEEEPFHREFVGAVAERTVIVLVSASAEDARAFREILDSSRRLVVNVPDLTGAQAVIDKFHPRGKRSMDHA